MIGMTGYSPAAKYQRTHARIPAEHLTCKCKSICPICTAVPQTLNGATDIVPHELCRQVKAYVNEFMTPFGN
ncbi:MAG: hypothetical protein ACI3XI_01390 [Eubacteriales bacterium]